jgi:uncharacterized membrane-anchored protein
MNQFYYREEDRFREASNTLKLRRLYVDGDYEGLLDFAILLNHEASFNNSKVKWAISEAMEARMPITQWHRDLAAEILGNQCCEE